MDKILDGFAVDNRYLVESDNHKDSVIKLSSEEYSELKEIGILSKTIPTCSIIGDLFCEVSIYFPNKSDSDFQKDFNDFYIVPMDNIGIVLAAATFGAIAFPIIFAEDIWAKLNS